MPPAARRSTPPCPAERLVRLGEVEPALAVVGIVADRALERLQRSRCVAPLHPHAAQHLQRAALAGVERESPLRGVLGLVEPVQAQLREGEVAERHRARGLQQKRPRERRLRLFKPPGRHQRGPEVALQERLIRRREAATSVERQAQLAYGALVVAASPLGVGEVLVRPLVVRRLRDRVAPEGHLRRPDRVALEERDEESKAQTRPTESAAARARRASGRRDSSRSPATATAAKIPSEAR